MLLAQGSTLAAVSPGFARLEALVHDFDEEFVTTTELAAAATAITGAATDQLQASATAAPTPLEVEAGGLNDESCAARSQPHRREDLRLEWRHQRPTLPTVGTAQNRTGVAHHHQRPVAVARDAREVEVHSRGHPGPRAALS